MATPRRFGKIRRLPSGRYQASYLGPDGIRRPASDTFERKGDADRWLSDVEAELRRGDWIDPDEGRLPLRDFAVPWVAERAGLRPKTRQLYEGLVRLHIAPTLGGYALADITPARVRTWRAGLLNDGVGAVTVAKAYRLLRTIMETAVEDRLIRVNPCQIRGASTEHSPERPTLTVAEVFAVADAMPKRYRLLVLLATFCSLRFGELAALTRADVDAEEGWVVIRRAVSEMAKGGLVTGPPKTAAGRRVVAIPSSLLAEVVEYLDEFVDDGGEALIFAGPKARRFAEATSRSTGTRPSPRREWPASTSTICATPATR